MVVHCTLLADTGRHRMTTVAAVDCGTNALRILIVRRMSDGRMVEIAREMRTVRLGEGVDSTGVISQAALDRTFAALDEYADLMRDEKVERVRMVATSASRDARNRDEFIAGVRARVGIDPEVITGDEEARLSFAGAISSVDLRESPAPFLVVDIGGGSTEFVVGDRMPVRWTSVDVGCVRMTERHLHSDPPSVAQIADAEADIARIVAHADAAVQLRSARTLLGLAGSVTTVAAWALDLAEYDADALHGSVISRGQVEAATEAYLSMSKVERAALPYMHPGRVDVIAGGAMVLREIMRQGDFDSVTVSERDILDGIACTLA